MPYLFQLLTDFSETFTTYCPLLPLYPINDSFHVARAGLFYSIVIDADTRGTATLT